MYCTDGIYAQGILEAIAHDQWQAGIYPSWQDALPIYE